MSALWLVTGAQASGKSTVSDLLARRFARGVHVRGGQFYRWAVKGWVDLGDEDEREARRLLELRYRLSSQVASEYAAAGFTTIVQDNIYGVDVERWLERVPGPEVEATIRERLGQRWIATDKTTGAFVGWFGLVRGENSSYDLGYRLRREWWGLGLATEGTAALIDKAFVSLGAMTVTAQTMAVNERSRAVMDPCGMRHSRTFHLEWDEPLPGTEKGEVESELTRRYWESRVRRSAPRP